MPRTLSPAHARTAALLAALAAPFAPAVAAAQAHVITAGERSAVIERIVVELETKYVFPDVARRMAGALRERRTSGAYESLRDAAEFADSLTSHLRAISHDRHLRVEVRGASAAGAGSADDLRPRRSADGVQEVRRLDGNVGYLRISEFRDVSRSGKRLTSALTELASTDALIIDLRSNRGGVPTSVMHLAGHLLAERTLVARLYSRPDDRTTEMWSADVPGVKYLGRAVFILTDRRTFSAAEAAAYHLQAFGRAKVVGDTTGGAAHRITDAALGDRFRISLPIMRPTNVKTGTNWEGVGVIPDIAVAPERALVAAHLSALKGLPASPERDRVIAELERR